MIEIYIYIYFIFVTKLFETEWNKGTKRFPQHLTQVEFIQPVQGHHLLSSILSYFLHHRVLEYSAT